MYVGYALKKRLRRTYYRNSFSCSVRQFLDDGTLEKCLFEMQIAMADYRNFLVSLASVPGPVHGSIIQHIKEHRQVMVNPKV